MDTAANGHCRQIERTDMTEHDSIDHHHADGGKLGDQDREGMGKKPAGGGKKHDRELSHAAFAGHRSTGKNMPN